MNDHPQDAVVPSLPEPAQWALQLAAQAWCEPECSDIEMDVRLATVFAKQLTKLAASFEAGRAAGRASAEPEGFVLVPREPTEKMVAEVEHAARLGGIWTAASVYHAMIQAAPTAPSGARVAEPETFRIALHEWAVAGWRSEVQNRPLVNIHRKRLDDFWRHAIRKAGGDPDTIVGPSHDELLAATPTPTASIAPKAEGEAFTVTAGVCLQTICTADAAPVAQAAAGASEQFKVREVLSELSAIDDAVRHWIEDKRPRSLLLYAITENIRSLLGSPRPSADADRASGGGAAQSIIAGEPWLKSADVRARMEDGE